VLASVESLDQRVHDRHCHLGVLLQERSKLPGHEQDALRFLDGYNTRRPRVMLDQRELAEEVADMQLTGCRILLAILLGSGVAPENDVQGQRRGILLDDPFAWLIDAPSARLSQSLDDLLIKVGEERGRCENLLNVHSISSGVTTVRVVAAS
jgi:hypothetical protein